jgi:hypothetical protein
LRIASAATGIAAPTGIGSVDTESRAFWDRDRLQTEPQSLESQQVRASLMLSAKHKSVIGGAFAQLKRLL